jgi:M6 family metalloprotease-like protein
VLFDLTYRRAVAAITAGLVMVTGGSAVALELGHRDAAAKSAPAVHVPISKVDFVPSGELRQVLRQPDGTMFRAVLSPASQGGLFEVAGGYSVSKDSSGVWRYVTGRDTSGRVQLSDAVAGVDAPPAGLDKYAGRVVTEVDPAEAAARESVRRQLQIASRQAQLTAAAAGQDFKPRVFHVPALLLATWWWEEKGQTEPQFQTGHGQAYFKKMLDGFGGNPRGSVTQFYFESSFGQFLVKVDVYGPYTSDRSRQDRCYYGGIDTETSGGDLDVLDDQLGIGGGGALGMALEAVPQANADIGANWGTYDNDNDGRVDFTMIIHSGGDMAATGNPCFTWSHAMQATLGQGEVAETTVGLPHGTLTHSGIPTSTPGTFIDRVLTIPEFASFATPLTIGVAAHEMAHSLGEPDYYDTSYSSVGTGDWDIMSGGSYLGNPAGSNPAIFNPASRVFQGWVTPTIVHGNLKGYRLRPRNALPYKSYHVGQKDPNLLLVPTYEIKVGQTDKLGHEWIADDVYGLAKDKKTGKYVVEGFYIENISRTGKARKINKKDPRGMMFDRKTHGSGLAVWHFDYWRQSTTYFAHGNDAQNDPNRYQMDLLEFDGNDNTQDLQLNYGRGNAQDLLSAAATGITSGTRKLPPFTQVQTGKPQGPIDLSGLTPPAGEASDEFVVKDNPNNAVMTVTINTEVAGDCKLSLTDPKGATTDERDSGGPGQAESFTVKNPIPGTWKANVGDFAACGTWSGRVVFEGPGGFNTAGAADTWSSWSKRPTGWAFTNISGRSNGLDLSNEAGGSNEIRLDVLNLKGRRDVSPGFITGARNAASGTGTLSVGRKNVLTMPVFSNGSKKAGKVKVAIHVGSATGPVVARKSVKLGGYKRKDIRFTYNPRREGETRLVAVVDPGHNIREASERNQVQATDLWAGPSKPKVLIVDDDAGLVHERVIAGALASLGVRYAIATAHPSVKLMKRYSAVIWEASVDRYEGQLDIGDRARIKKYLAGGGKLLITSNRIMDAVGTADSTPQQTESGVMFGAQYLGVRIPNGNATYTTTIEHGATVTGRGLLANQKFRINPPPIRPFVGLAGLAQAGPGTLVDADDNGRTIKPFGTAKGVAQYNKGALDAVQLEKDPAYGGVMVNGDAAHGRFKTVTLGWNIADNSNASATIGVLRSVLKHFRVKLGTYKVKAARPLIYHQPIRDRVSGMRVPITAIVLGRNVGGVKLYFRRHAGTGFYKVKMRRSGAKGAYLGYIPGKAVTPDGVDYFIKVGRGRSFDPSLARTRVLLHGFGVQLPEVKNPLPRGA